MGRWKDTFLWFIQTIEFKCFPVSKTERFITSVWDFNLTNTDNDAEIVNNKIRIYPNPANDHITIEGFAEDYSNYYISLVNQFGESITSKQVSKNLEVQILLKGLNDSVYFVVVTDNRNRLIYLGKILKVKN
ncbi:MAG: T9SS type A sorting domain-containing protein [Saprospiraceae bacterium]|nr:T9SS type A sorting domain-containing protein [Saprospiraceae bacterium]